MWLDTARGVDLPPEARRCGYVFQDYALFPHLDGLAERRLRPARAARRAPRPRASRCSSASGWPTGPTRGRARCRAASASASRVARALAVEPAALLLDEPLSALDARTRAAAARELAAVLHAAAVPALLVTHDFQEAALLGDRVGVIDAGRIVQTGSAGDLAAAPASPFVADFTGAIVLTGTAAPATTGSRASRLDGGGEVTSTEAAAGPVAVTLYPWDIALAPPGSVDPGSARNHLDVEVVSVTVVGTRVRVGLAAPQPLTAELTEPAVRALHVAPGQRAVASWKATATRLLPLE